MSNEKPILFKDDMIRAILEGRKCQTRRLLKPQPPEKFCTGDVAAITNGSEWAIGISRIDPRGGQAWPADPKPGFTCRYGKPGDHLWVQEDYGYKIRNVGGTPHEQAAYRATDPDAVSCYDCNGKEQPLLWQPAETMPREASRITLEITDVRVERLQDISQEDAQAEGMELTGWRPTYNDPDSGGDCMTPVDNFAELWESIYGPNSWDANPWVWCISFKRIDA